MECLALFVKRVRAFTLSGFVGITGIETARKGMLGT